MATIQTGLNTRNSIAADSLGGPGPIAFDINQVDKTLEYKLNEIKDYIRLRLADGIVDVELDQAHYDMSVKQAFVRYRQRGPTV